MTRSGTRRSSSARRTSPSRSSSASWWHRRSKPNRACRVVRKLNLGGTFVCDRGLRTGDLDVYVEYTGTAVTAVFHESVPHDSAQALERARELYARSDLTVLAPLGFNNTFTILVRARDAATWG